MPIKTSNIWTSTKFFKIKSSCSFDQENRTKQYLNWIWLMYLSAIDHTIYVSLLIANVKQSGQPSLACLTALFWSWHVTLMNIDQIVVGICIGVIFGVDGAVRGEIPKWYAIVIVVFICIFVGGFAWSWGPLAWLVPSEIFPLEIRSAAQSLNVSVNMGCTFLIAQTFFTMLCHFKSGFFFLFGFFTLAMTIFIYLVLPETNNIPIQEMPMQIAIVRVLSSVRS